MASPAPLPDVSGYTNRLVTASQTCPQRDFKVMKKIIQKFKFNQTEYETFKVYFKEEP